MFDRPQHPQSIGGVLDTGFRLFAAGIKALVPITYIGALLGGIWNWYFGTQMAGMQTGSVPPEGLFGEILLGIIPLAIVGTAVLAAAISRAGAIYRGEESSFGQAFAKGLRRWLAVFLATILYTLAVLGGSILLIVPGIFLSIALAFCFYAAAMDGRGPVDSLRYSYRIVKGNWWRCAAVFTVLFVIAMVFYFAIGLVAALFLIGGDPQQLGQPSLVADIIVMPVLSAVVAGLFYCLGYTLYEDLKLRNEGADLAGRIESLEQA